MTDITVNEWRSALEYCDLTINENAKTVSELSKILGVAPRTAREIVAKKVSEGVLRSVGRKKVAKSDGSYGYAVAYEIIKCQKKLKSRSKAERGR